MDPHFIRKVDFWLGVPLCWIFSIILLPRRLLFSKRQAPAPPRSILFIKLIEQGATVLAVDALKQAAKLVGRENVHFLVFAQNSPIIEILDIVPPENIRRIKQTGLLTFAASSLRALWHLRRKKIDASVDMEFYSRASALFGVLAGCRMRVGLHRFSQEAPYRGRLMTHNVQYNPHLHTALAYRALVDTLSLDPCDQPMPKQAPESLSSTRQRLDPFLPGEVEKAKMSMLLRSLFGLEDKAAAVRPLVILNPNTSDMLPMRKWPDDRFVELGNKLLNAFPDIRIVLTGAPDEAESVAAIAAKFRSGRVASLAGMTTFRELLVLYCLSDVLVTNDSGPAHFSALTPIHCVVLFGPETPGLFGPLGNRATVLWAGLACSPCVNVYNHRFTVCRNNRCMQEISVGQVFEAVEVVLRKRIS